MYRSPEHHVAATIAMGRLRRRRDLVHSRMILLSAGFEPETIRSEESLEAWMEAARRLDAERSIDGAKT